MMTVMIPRLPCLILSVSFQASFIEALTDFKRSRIELHLNSGRRSLRWKTRLMMSMMRSASNGFAIISLRLSHDNDS